MYKCINALSLPLTEANYYNRVEEARYKGEYRTMMTKHDVNKKTLILSECICFAVRKVNFLDWCDLLARGQ